ncbi:hypothetical protein N9D02_05035 [Emcibacteraceae bacterium]|jgi:hypothetical protein|uniref:hypothetical protein n=1 Tax=Pseudemcibacter sp. TaxID=2943293 RepID=UPI00231B8BCE|nr:hypothetical protein [Emcibacteraceae bacterium]MDA9770386.1 hypothetical protein [Emcibacteraceae bacterium]MDG1022032.1 hypothetical protein [Emcibacteraceae bacterium]MDG1727662.1 hypothetical protein [Emcibacteraceae bacterium]
MKKDHQVRKPLRQRVADRKRGIKEVKPMSSREKRIRKSVKFILTVAQYLGLFLLLLALGGIVNNGYEVKSWDLIVVYSSMFIIGRAGITIMNSISTFK